jgi:TolB-like protein
MKTCPKCARTYADETLNFCLDDGEWLAEDPDSSEESKTAILYSAGVASEVPTRTIRKTGMAINSAPRAAQSLLVFGIIGLVLIAGYFGYRYFASNSNDVASEYKKIDSIAVLPFENGTGDPGMDYLSDGLSEELLDKFSQLPELKVIARQSSFKYRAPNVDLSEVAKNLGVAALVTGRVTKQGNQLIVRAELIDVRENKQLWGEQYIRETSGAMTIRQEIAASVASSLRPRLTRPQKQQLGKNGTTNPEAYELLLQGRFSKLELKNAQQYFEQAVSIDPNYAEAWARLAGVHLTLVNGGVEPKERLAKAEAAARRALQLDSSLPIAHQTYANWLITQWKWGEADSEYRRAIDLDQNLDGVHGAYSRLLSFVGRHDDAVREALRNRELNPVEPFAHNLEGSILFYARRYDEAVQASRKALELETWSNFYLTLGNSYAGKKLHREAIEAYLQVTQQADIVWTSRQIRLGAAYANIGERGKALSILRDLQTTESYVSPAELPVLLIALGLGNEAFTSFEKAIERRDPKMGYLNVEPAFDQIRGDPRFADIVRRVGLPG